MHGFVMVYACDTWDVRWRTFWEISSPNRAIAEVEDPAGGWFKAVVKKTFRYSNVFLLQPLIPAFRISEHIFEKRYKLTISCAQS